ncbi:MAG: hypothetical protein FWH40_09700, partial [Coriobacteriia bacterium]|nr:hypothetical protein [Coriobacteriia bacterium]
WVYSPGDTSLNEYEDPGVNGPKFSPGTREGQSTTRMNTPIYDGSSWSLGNVGACFIDFDAFEEWKTKFYTLTGLSASTGQPTRATLESLGMANVANDLAAIGKLGS